MDFIIWSNQEVWMIFPCKMLVDLYELLVNP